MDGDQKRRMSNLRLIARLDIKAPNLIKTIRLEGLRKLGIPTDFARRYYKQNVDEIVYIDAVASLYERNTITDLVSETARDVFIPITVGGGVRSVDDARALLRAGADKIAINTAATKRPELIREMAEMFGAQCMVLSVHAKSRSDGGWEAYSDMGREHTNRDVVDWVREAEALGAGEILLTSVDREGTASGFDLDLIAAVTGATTIPVIASGGAGTFEDIRDAHEKSGADAVALAYMLHYEKVQLDALRDQALDAGLPVRKIA
jgi:cyclase